MEIDVSSPFTEKPRSFAILFLWGLWEEEIIESHVNFVIFEEDCP